MKNEIKKLVKNGYSDAYIEAVIYGKYKSNFSIKQIDIIINNIKKEVLNNENN